MDTYIEVQSCTSGRGLYDFCVSIRRNRIFLLLSSCIDLSGSLTAFIAFVLLIFATAIQAAEDVCNICAANSSEKGTDLPIVRKPFDLSICISFRYLLNPVLIDLKFIHIYKGTSILLQSHLSNLAFM